MWSTAAAGRYPADCRCGGNAALYRRGRLLKYGDLTQAFGVERLALPSAPTMTQPKAGEPCHQDQLGRPHVTTGCGVLDKTVSDLGPVMGPCDLPHHVIKGLDIHVVRTEHKDAADLAKRDASKLGHDKLDDETSASIEVSGCIREHR